MHIAIDGDCSDESQTQIWPQTSSSKKAFYGDGIFPTTLPCLIPLKNFYISLKILIYKNMTWFSDEQFNGLFERTLFLNK